MDVGVSVLLVVSCQGIVQCVVIKFAYLSYSHWGYFEISTIQCKERKKIDK